MRRLFRASLILLILCTASLSQALGEKVQLTSAPRPLMAKFAFYSPDGLHLLVTLCEYSTGQGPTLIGCRPWRYHLADKRWERIVLTPDDPHWSVDSATYSPDGKAIAATIVKCTPAETHALPKCPYLENRLLLIDVASGKHRTIASENARFQPSFAPDGKGLVYWQLDNLQGVATGTTAYPAKQAQTLYATHNLHTLSLSDEVGHLAIKVRAQVPLAPPRVFADGIRVTVAGRGVMGVVTTKDGPYQGLWGVTRAMEDDDSLLIGDLQTGSMFAPLPRSHPMRVIFDVLDLADTKTQRIIYRQGVSQVNVSDANAINITRITPEFRPDSYQDNREVKHAAFSPNGNSFVYVFGRDLAIAPLRPNPDFQIIERPVFTPVINQNN